MSSLRGRDPGAGKFYGSRAIEVYPAEKIYEEAAFLAYYMHWSRDDILNLTHGERLRWCEQVSNINAKINQEPENDIFRL